MHARRLLALGTQLLVAQWWGAFGENALFYDLMKIAGGDDTVDVMHAKKIASTAMPQWMDT